MFHLWRLNTLSVWVLLLQVCQINEVACSLNNEGKALLRFKERVVKDPLGALSTWRENRVHANPCSWFGVECADGHVVSLRLKDLCLKGTLAPELGHLIHIKSIVLRNNFLSGHVPEEIGDLKELEVLDLGYNNFSGPLPHGWGNKFSILLLDNNSLFHITPETKELVMVSEDESELSPLEEESSKNTKLRASNAASKHLKALLLHEPVRERDLATRRVLMGIHLPSLLPANADIGAPSAPLGPNPQTSPRQSTPTPISSPPPSSTSERPLGPSSDSSPFYLSPNNNQEPPPPPPPPTVPLSVTSSSSSRSPTIIIISTVVVGGFILLGLASFVGFRRRNKVTRLMPCGGISGSLERSLVDGAAVMRQDSSNGVAGPWSINGVQKMNRSVIEAACEDFSNVIGSTSMGKLYKGNLSGGAEIFVLSHTVKSSEDWSDHLESQFKKKVVATASVKHKNFLNLVGYCEDEEPFTRMLVFEYAPSGTLFEHLHVREAEHLDWNMRLRTVMGVAYCLDHMHKLNPPIIHGNLTVYAVNLSEDYAAKLSDFALCNDVPLVGQPRPPNIDSMKLPEFRPEDNVYSFGLILLEAVTGKVLFSEGNGALEGWALEFLGGKKSIKELVDPLLRQFDEDQLKKIGEVIISCTRQDPKERPEIGEVTLRLRETTGVGMDAAAPRASHMWWAELASRAESVTSRDSYSDT